MKKAKIILSMALSIAFTAGVFAGCTKDKGTQNNNAANANQKEEPITINWMPQNDAPLDTTSPVIQELEKKLGVKLNFIYIERNKEVEILNIRIASGEIPDVMKLTEDRFRTYIAQGVLADFTEDQVKKSAPKLYEMEKKNGGNNAWEYPKEGGKLYGIPCLNPNGAYQFVPIWRDDWLKNVGITKLPETLKEAEDAFYKFVNNDPDKNGKKDTYALSNTGMSTIFGAFGGVPYFSKGGGLGFTWSLVNGKAMATAVMPEMKEALTLLNKWYKDGLIDPEFISEENKGQSWANTVTFWNGKIGFSTPGLPYHVNKPYYTGGVGSANYTNFLKLQPNGSYDYGKPLVGPNGKSGTERWGTYPGTYVAFGRQVAKDPKKLAKLLEINEKIVSDPETWMLSRYGIENVTYKISTVDGQKIVQGTGIGADATKAPTLGMGNAGVGYLNETNFDMVKQNEAGRYSFADKVGNVNPNYLNVVWGGLPSAAQLKPAVEKKIREAYILFIIGEKKLSDFDKFVEDLNKSGLETLTKEANDWYKKYNK